jgi:hypothetical protein
VVEIEAVGGQGDAGVRADAEIDRLDCQDHLHSEHRGVVLRGPIGVVSVRARGVRRCADARIAWQEKARVVDRARLIRDDGSSREERQGPEREASG